MDVKVPDIGDFTEVPVIEVLVAVGDQVEAEDPLITLESEKATMDVPAPGDGTVEEILVAVGDTVSEGTAILRLSGDDGEADGEKKPAAVEEPAGAGEPSAEEPVEGEADEEVDQRSAPSARTSSPPVYASPSVRRLARQKGVDLGGVAGSGRKGRITVEDVELQAPGRGDRTAATGASIEGPKMAPWPQVDHAKHGEIERVELSRIKQISGPNLARNWVHIPHVTHNDEADITGLEAFRKQINSEQDVKVTMVALLLKACVPVLKQYPEFNSSLDGDGLILKRYYHLGFAADTPEGLLVPVIRDVDKKGLLQVAAELIELSAKAREGKLGPAEMAGATFTISSLGGIGGTSFTPIVNAPQVAILGVTRAAMKPVWDGEQFQPRLMVPLSLSYDHRVVDGAAAARFCVALV
ncbi:MAG: 2-oxo acid dehydrogenase subunit E2, partial [Thermoleophilia bacterium]|nr:2-oxo acid dehydrogenase subunit E2 [Thermoleophilia bacterium]